ncbi:MAG: dTDP-4-dehydrorhamnose 3,5-epimerase family protein, partial [Nitrospira sp.]|nr:dTDP-4-dehydrorhamnose 3,5-epimerase family protein [Nitrospira sp.]
MRVTRIDIPGVLVLEPTLLSDHRGSFMETYHEERYRNAGIAEQFVQDNYSRSIRNTLRGLHFQEPQAQGKLVMALEGTVYDVVVDIRKGSPSFGKWYGIELSGDTPRQMYIPP